MADQPFQLFIKQHSTKRTTPVKMCSGDLGSQCGQGPSGFMLLPCVKMMMIMISYGYSKSIINQRRLMILKTLSRMKMLELRLIFYWSLFVMFQLRISQNSELLAWCWTGDRPLIEPMMGASHEANISRINVDTMYNTIYLAHIYPNKIGNLKEKSRSRVQYRDPQITMTIHHVTLSIFEYITMKWKTWNADSVVAYFLLFFRFAKSLRLHLVAILDSCKNGRQVQFGGIFVSISIAN